MRSTPVQTREVPLTELRVPEVKVEAVRSVEASMRLDAVASAGFRLSRSKMLDLIKSGDVKYALAFPHDTVCQMLLSLECPAADIPEVHHPMAVMIAMKLNVPRITHCL